LIIFLPIPVWFGLRMELCVWLNYERNMAGILARILAPEVQSGTYGTRIKSGIRRGIGGSQSGFGGPILTSILMSILTSILRPESIQNRESVPPLNSLSCLPHLLQVLLQVLS
jgi:hypothetical protein